MINEDNLGEMGGLVVEDAMKDVHEDVQSHAQHRARLHPVQLPRLAPRQEVASD